MRLCWTNHLCTYHIFLTSPVQYACILEEDEKEEEEERGGGFSFPSFLLPRRCAKSNSLWLDHAYDDAGEIFTILE